MENQPIVDPDPLRFEFQWSVDDLPALEAVLNENMQPGWYQSILLVSRLIAYALTFCVAWLLLPDTNLMIIFLIALTGSLSIWVAFFSRAFLLRHFQRSQAMDSMKVGWIFLKIDQSGILRQTDTSQIYHSWFAVSDVQTKNGALWIKFGRADGEYFPARLFNESLTLEDCLARIEVFKQRPLEPVHLDSDASESATKH